MHGFEMGAWKAMSHLKELDLDVSKFIGIRTPSKRKALSIRIEMELEIIAAAQRLRRWKPYPPLQ
jgi:hypothetical protein